VKKRKTKDPRIWFSYLCWNIQIWMKTHIPYYPMWLRKIILTRTDSKRHGLSWRMIDWWKSQNPNYVPQRKPLPWYIGECALGPFAKPWKRIARFFNHWTGGLSHRCEFTDPENGALYTGVKDPFMNRLFERFITNISKDIEIQEALEEKYETYHQN
jgi:hypothetical protein